MNQRWEEAVRNWNPGRDWLIVDTIDAHTAGEPLRIIVAGLPRIEGDSMLERRRSMQQNHDVFRRILMWEPRGHADMYGCVIVPPESPNADFGVLFLHNEGYSSMCGHGIIAVTKAAIDVGFVEVGESPTTVVIDSPAGQITARANVQDSRARQINFDNVPSFVVARDATVRVDPWGEISYDLAFGGAYYAYVDAQQFPLTLTGDNVAQLIDLGRNIKRAVAGSVEIRHPIHSDLSFLYGTIFYGPPADAANYSRHVCVFADGEIDRSPTGTGVSGRAALEVSRGRLKRNEKVTIESILGTVFSVRVVGDCMLGNRPAVIPNVGGEAFLTGRHQFFVEPGDWLGDGFLLR